MNQDTENDRKLTCMKKKVYICAPLGGQVNENLQNAIRYTEYALKTGAAPITTHFYALCLNDHNPIERRMGMEAGQSLLWFCDEMWIFGDRISAGMKEEIGFCKNLHIPMRTIGEKELKRVLGGELHEQQEKIREMAGSRGGTVADDADLLNDEYHLSLS